MHRGHSGASQSDIANLKGEDVDWQNSAVSFTRKKTGAPAIVHLGSEALMANYHVILQVLWDKR
jgi:hypothetical protein